ncbi:hypothetical protein [Phyllobacterium chamaecytisi]|uniref:hypothetical protein n=1 Tax=Phyllobacterium chamaecytisi TaxID=2876082 RepID=UPI001CCDE008|nr:hypothetical protein [Phyllobacterium sp. KW56]MBZ9605814.1 hypothetical protein [Phyllobacterium sp. KW56]
MSRKLLDVFARNRTASVMSVAARGGPQVEPHAQVERSVRFGRLVLHKCASCSCRSPPQRMGGPGVPSGLSGLTPHFTARPSQ